MTQHVPEHVATTVYQSLPARTEPFSATEVRHLMVQAINADRAQHDLAYAREIIDRHEGRGVIWGRGDVECALDDRMNRAGACPPGTQAEYDALVDRAMESPYWSALEECTERDWVMIDLAVDDAIGDN